MPLAPTNSSNTPTPGSSSPDTQPATRWADLVELVSQCSRRLRRELTDRLGRHALGESQFSLLWACHQAPSRGLNQNQLAAVLALSPAQVSGLVEQLRAKGLLELRRNETDRRQKLWQLTDSGQQVLQAILADLSPWSSDAQQNFGANEAYRLTTLLDQLASAARPISGRGAVAASLVAMVFLCLTWMTGCSPTYYRLQADADVEKLVDQKACDPRWAIDDFTIDIDPRSRMFDPYDPDKEPIPPDDPTAHKLMHCVDGMCGDGTWHDNGDTPYTANPDWMQFVPYNDKGEFIMDLDAAIQVGLLNSTGYQRNLETLYLSALDVSFERFRFDVQFSNVTNLLFTSDGRLRNGTGVSSDTLALTNDFTAGGSGPQIGGKLFANGGELLIGIANSLVWQFSGNNTYTPTTLINFSLFEPLLRAGGRARVLERLTRTERGLLYNIRQMEFYRQSFYTFLTTGRDPGNGPSRQGGVVGSGLEGFSGVGSGGFGGLAANSGGAAAGGTVAGGAGAAEAGGYYGLLQDQQQIRNREANLAGLRDSLAQLEAIYQAGRIRRLQVDLAKQAIYTAESQLLTTKAAYDAGVENYLVTLGLPPDLPVKISDPMLAPFELIDPAFPPLQRNLADLQADAGDLIVPLREESSEARFQTDAVIRQTLADPQFQQRWEGLRQLLVSSSGRNSIGGIITDTRGHFPSVERDLRLFESRLGQRVQVLQRQQADESPQTPGETESEDIRQLKSRPPQLRQRFAQIAKDLEDAPTQLAAVDAEITWLVQRGPTATPEEFRQRIITQLHKDPAQFSRDQEGKELDPRYLYVKALLDAIPDRLGDLSQSVLNLSLVQAEARAESITLIPIEMQPEEALEIACKNRLDWMNARGALVDSWRLIAFNANDLESNLNLVFNGDISNTGRNPFDLNSANGRLSVGVQFQAPLTRLAQRNVYRQSLIEYQQSRRSYYQFVDRVNQGLRNTLRTIKLNQRNFELRRVAVRLAIDQVDQAREALRAPPKSGELTNLGDTAAQDLVNALAALLNVQNDFLSVWLNYEVQRVTLDLLLGTMQLDERGMWIDPDHQTMPGRTSGENCPTDGPATNSQQPELITPPAADRPAAAAGILPARREAVAEGKQNLIQASARSAPATSPPNEAPSAWQIRDRAVRPASADLNGEEKPAPAKTPTAAGDWKPALRTQNGS